MPAVRGECEVVGIKAGQVSSPYAIAVEVEGFPPAWLDVAFVAVRALEHDESIVMGRQRDRATLELDFPRHGELGVRLDVVDHQSIVSRADRREPVSARGENDAIDSLLAGRGAIDLAERPGAGDRLERLRGLAVDPGSGDGDQRRAPAIARQEHDRDLAATARACPRSTAPERRPARSVPAQIRAMLVRCRMKRRISTAIENRLMAT